MNFCRTVGGSLKLAVCLLGAAGPSLLWAGVSEFAPTNHPTTRYQHLWEKSPFIVGKPEVAESSPGLEQRFVLTAIAGTEESPVIFVLDRQSLSRTMVSQQKNSTGVELVSVQSRSDPRQSWAVIRLGAEQATIKYDVSALMSVNQEPDAKTQAAQPVGAPNPVAKSSTNSPVPTAAKMQPSPTPSNVGKTVRRRPITLNQSP